MPVVSVMVVFRRSRSGRGVGVPFSVHSRKTIAAFRRDVVRTFAEMGDLVDSTFDWEDCDLWVWKRGSWEVMVERGLDNVPRKVSSYRVKSHQMLLLAAADGDSDDDYP